MLFDLDDTLVVDEATARESFLATAGYAATHHPQLDTHRLALDARTRARELWRAAPTHPYCARIGISSWEGLWCPYEGAHPEVAALRAWAPTYRQQAWRLALEDQSIDDGALAAELGERFGVERRARHRTFEDALPVVRTLAASHRLALVTNGLTCLQHEKLRASGLAVYFEVVVVSGELGVGKPDPAVFAAALSPVATGDDGAVMIGDSFHRDVAGARAAGLHAVWLNRDGAPRPPGHPEVQEIRTLSELPGALEGIGRAERGAQTSARSGPQTPAH